MEVTLLGTTLELRYKTPSNLISLRDLRPKVHEEIFGTQPNQPPPPPNQTPTGGMKLEMKKKRTSITLEQSRLAIDDENDQEAEVIGNVSVLLNKIYRTVNYRQLEIARIGVRVVWCLKWDEDFASLLSKYKNNVYKQSSLVGESLDVGLVLTLEDSGYKVNYISGPMDSKQLGTNFIFEHDYPAVSVFIDIDRYTNNLVNSQSNVEPFLRETVFYSKRKAEETKELLIS